MFAGAAGASRARCAQRACGRFGRASQLGSLRVLILILIPIPTPIRRDPSSLSSSLSSSSAECGPVESSARALIRMRRPRRAELREPRCAAKLRAPAACGPSAVRARLRPRPRRVRNKTTARVSLSLTAGRLYKARAAINSIDSLAAEHSRRASCARNLCPFSASPSPSPSPCASAAGAAAYDRCRRGRALRV